MTDLEIAAFVEARIADDNEAALDATQGEWIAIDGGVLAITDDDDREWPVADTQSQRNREDRVHIARHQPARVLCEIEAKRERLQLLRIAWNAYQDSQHSREPFDAFARGDACGRFVMALRMVALDAAIWREHPDYRSQWADPGWRPTMAGSRPA